MTDDRKAPESLNAFDLFPDLRMIANLQAKIEAILVLRQFIAQAAPQMIRPDDPRVRGDILGAATLMRANRLGWAMSELFLNNVHDVVALPFRPIFELWNFGLLHLLAPERTTEHFDDFVRDLEKSERLAGSDVPFNLTKGDRKGSVSAEELARRVSSALKDAQDPYFEAPINNYNWIYRRESMKSIHSGYMTIWNYHRREEQDVLTVLPAAINNGSGAFELILSWTMIVHLARYVFGRFGLSTDELDEVAGPLTQPIDFTKEPKTEV